GAAALDGVAVAQRELAPGFPGGLYAVIGERDRTIDEPVVHLFAGFVQDDLLEPVGAGPAACFGAFNAHGPWGDTGFTQRVGQFNEVIERGISVERLTTVPFEDG